MDPLLTKLVEELQAVHNCHTVILYGSRARGDFTEASDYDALGVRETGEVRRDARLWNGKYLDAFIYSEDKILDPPEHMLDMRKGRILLEKGTVARDLQRKLEERFQKGPSLLRKDEITALEVWHEKALERIRLGGIQGDYRRMELVPGLLEHYFTTRGVWYLGPKAAFQTLEKERPDLLALFREALKPGAPLAAIETLAATIGKEIAREAKPASEPESSPPRQSP